MHRQLDETTRARRLQAAPFAKGQPTDYPFGTDPVPKVIKR